jgi:hypothetical protein
MLVNKNVKALCMAFLQNPRIRTIASRSEDTQINYYHRFSGGYDDS